MSGKPLKYICTLLLCLALVCACFCTAQAAELAILSQPEGMLAREGEIVSATVKAQGDGLTYEWYFRNNGSASFSKTTSFTGDTYTTTMNESRDGREVYCIITDKYGNSVQSDTVVFLMNKTIKITKHPESVKVKENDTATVRVETAGKPVSYAWYYTDENGETKLSTQYTGDTFSIKMTPETDGCLVHCVLTDYYGYTYHTNHVYLTMARKPEIYQQPRDVKVSPGEEARVTVFASGEEPFTYTWYYKNKGSDTFIKTAAFKDYEYKVEMSSARRDRQVYCVVTDAYGQSVKSNVVTLMMNNYLRITSQPEEYVEARSGENATVSLKAEGDGLTYEWYYRNPGQDDFVKTTSFKGNTYTIEMTSARDGREVYCVLTDQYGNSRQSLTATLAMVKPVTINWHTEEVRAECGEKAEVHVSATGKGLTYEWFFKAKGKTTYNKTSSFKGNTYSVTMDESRDGRMVYCVVTDQYGNTAKTGVVTLNMIIPEPVTIDWYTTDDAQAEYGEKAYIQVSATGRGLTYEWYFKNKGASTFSKTTAFKSSTYSVEMDASRNGRQVYCVVTDKYGNTAKTGVVTLKLDETLRIKEKPQNVTVAEGKTASVSFTANGTGLTYTWYYKNAGASTFSKTTSFTGNTYSIKMDESRSGRQVYCVVRDKYGNTVQTEPVMLITKGVLTIVNQPANITVENGDTAQTSFTAVGDGLTYTWYYKNAGASQFTKTTSFKGSSYAIDMSSARSGRQVYCVVKDKYGKTATTDTVTLGMVPTGLQYTQDWDGQETIMIEGYTGSAAKLTIPDNINGKPVRTINAYAFEDCTKLTSVSIPATVNEIGVGAFSGCTKLTTINIPSGVQKLASGLFKGCKALKSITIPASVTSIEGYAFSDCMALTKITLPSKVKTLGIYAFQNCTALESIALPSTVTSIGNHAFMGCSALTTATVGSKVKTVGDYAFQNCTSLKSIKFPSTLTSLGEYAFWNCSALTSATLGKITRIGDYAFANCGKLKSITIPSTVTSLGENAFYSCASLTAVTVPSGVTALEDSVFAGCTSLKSVSLPDTVTKIGPHAFAWCGSLTSVTIPASTTAIGDRAFTECTALITVTMNSKLKTLGVYAFGGCTALTAVKLPSTVTSIGAFAFGDCNKLTTANIPAKVTKVPDGLFMNCGALTAITIPGGVTSIGADAFSSCYQLSKITIPASVTSIGDSAFYNCIGLTSVTLNQGLKTIGHGAFNNCQNIKSIQMPSTVTKIGSDAFRYCLSIPSLTLSANITSIGQDAFTDCEKLTVTVTKGSYAHTYCKTNNVRCTVK